MFDQTTGTDSHIFTYTWDSRDNLLTHTEAGTPTTMVYDAASRIQTSAKGAAVTTMTYDPNGNRIGAVTGASPRFTLTYDRENRLIEQTEDGAIIAEFGYDPFGHKRTERLARNSFDLLWDGDSYLGVRDNDISADLTKLFLSADGAIFAEQNTPWDKTGRVDWFVDFLGSVVATQAYGNPISDGRRYTPFGDLLSGDTLPPGSFGWVGNVGYRHTGLPQATSYMLHRHYDPASCQWISRDMLWPDERAYGYVNANPIFLNDRLGLSPASVFWQCYERLRQYMPRRRACEICKRESGSRVNCESAVFTTQKGDMPPCVQNYKDDWAVANHGCIQACKIYMCAQLPPLLKQICERSCKSQCADATGGNGWPAWSICAVTRTNSECQDCCNTMCGSTALCLQKCDYCCSGKPDVEYCS